MFLRKNETLSFVYLVRRRQLITAEKFATSPRLQLQSRPWKWWCASEEMNVNFFLVRNTISGFFPVDYSTWTERRDVGDGNSICLSRPVPKEEDVNETAHHNVVYLKRSVAVTVVVCRRCINVSGWLTKWKLSYSILFYICKFDCDWSGHNAE